jgi:excinuclease ABC subunit A
MNEFIEIKNARTNNLKDVSLKLPINKITCISGPSGSGKSSLAFHTIFSESKRRFMNSLPNSFRFFSEKPPKAEVDKIFPVLPAWVLPQNNPILSSRQNVADLLDLTRVTLKVFAVEGEILCPEHNEKLERYAVADKIKNFMNESKLKEVKAIHCFLKKTDYTAVFDHTMQPSRSIKTKRGEINNYTETDNYYEILRIRPNKLEELEARLKEINTNILKLNMIVRFSGSEEFVEVNSKSLFECSKCDFQSESKQASIDLLNVFSPLGACPACKGYGSTYIYDRKKLVKDPSLSIDEGAVSIVESAHFDYYVPILRRELKKVGIDTTKPFSKLPQKVWKYLYDGVGDYPGFHAFFDYLERKRYKKTVRIFTKRIQTEVECPKCEGTRVKKENQNVSLIKGRKQLGIQSVFQSTIEDLSKAISDYEVKETKVDYKKVNEALKIAADLGIGYLPLARKVKTLSASEYQRALLVKYFLFKGSGGLFVFDEPSLGLRIEEQKMILRYMRKLRDQNNTVLLVDHSDYFQAETDELINIGPGAGPYGGEITYQGSPKKVEKVKKPKFEDETLKSSKLEIKDVSFFGNTLKSLQIPTNQMTCVIGAPGVGKSKVFMDGISAYLAEHFDNEQNTSKVKIGKVNGLTPFEGYTSIDGYSLKANSRSSVGTYLEILPEFRKYYSSLPTAKAMGLDKGHFSPNSAKGRCATCEGRGVLEADMKYFETVQYACPDCGGLKLRPMYANISNGKYKYHEIIKKPFCEVYKEVGESRKLTRINSVLENFKIDYLSLDRSLTSLSGGEKQRLKLAKYFLRERSHQLLILENISFGLSIRELRHITSFLRQFCSGHNTVIVVDPNPLVSLFSHNTLELKRNKASVTAKLNS